MGMNDITIYLNLFLGSSLMGGIGRHICLFLSHFLVCNTEADRSTLILAKLLEGEL